MVKISGNNKVSSEFLIIFPNAAPIEVNKTIGTKSLNEFFKMILNSFFLGITNDNKTPMNRAVIGLPNKLNIFIK